MSDCVVASRRVVLPTGVEPATVTIRDGLVASVQRGSVDPAAEDFGDSVIMPALADSHVHINEPGRTDWEGFATATRAAAAGGITTLADMPLNCDPVTTSLDALHTKLSETAGKLHVDCGFWGGVVPGNAHELAPMVRAGVLGFKAFLCHSGIDDFPASTRADLSTAMPILKGCGVPLLVHAELETELAAPLVGPPHSYLRYLHSRPAAWEDAAIAMMIELVAATGCRAHVVHLSSGSALPLIRSAKERGLPITVETCPHYLCLVAEDIPDGATEYKCAPPIREAANRELLWAGLADGTIDFVVSDHSPCAPALKLREQGNFEEAWGGIASVQLGLSSVWTEARRRGHSLADMLRWMSAGPLTLLRQGHRKGRIAPGMRGDLVAFDPRAERTIEADSLLFRHPLTPYLGHRVRGAVRATWLGGHRVVRDGTLCDLEPRGRVLLGAP